MEEALALKKKRASDVVCLSLRGQCGEANGNESNMKSKVDDADQERYQQASVVQSSEQVKRIGSGFCCENIVEGCLEYFLYTFSYQITKKMGKKRLKRCSRLPSENIVIFR